MKLSQAAKLLGARLIGEDAEFNTVSTDTRRLKSGDLFIALRGPHFDGHDFIEEAVNKGAAGVVVSDPVDVSFPIIRVNDTKIALTFLAGHHRDLFNIPMVAITGSCGKTTTRAMVECILQQCGNVLASQDSFNNDIGVSLTLLRLKPEHDCAVLELGANHPGEIAYLTHLVKPTVAIITNAGNAHLEGFGDLEGVARAKGEIFQSLPREGVAVINNDDPYSGFWRYLVGDKRMITFGIDHPADVRATDIHFSSNGNCTFKLIASEGDAEIHLPVMGKHNVCNALAAAAVALALNVSLENIQTGLKNLLPEKGRLVERKGYHGAIIIDDSYNANPSSVSAAIKVLSQRQGNLILVLGDMLELGMESERFHKQMGELASKSGIHRLFCYGPLSRNTAESFGSHGYHFDDLETLLEKLKNHLSDNVIVLIKGSRSMGMDRIAKSLIEE